MVEDVSYVATTLRREDNSVVVVPNQGIHHLLCTPFVSKSFFLHHKISHGSELHDPTIMTPLLTYDNFVVVVVPSL